MNAAKFWFRVHYSPANNAMELYEFKKGGVFFAFCTIILLIDIILIYDLVSVEQSI